MVMELDGEKVLEAVIKGKINGTKQTLDMLGDNVSHDVRIAFQLLIDELEDALKMSTTIKLSRMN
jgi:hypothetical protein